MMRLFFTVKRSTCPGGATEIHPAVAHPGLPGLDPLSALELRAVAKNPRTDPEKRAAAVAADDSDTVALWRKIFRLYVQKVEVLLINSQYSVSIIWYDGYHERSWVWHFCGIVSCESCLCVRGRCLPQQCWSHETRASAIASSLSGSWSCDGCRRSGADRKDVRYCSFVAHCAETIMMCVYVSTMVLYS